MGHFKDQMLYYIDFSILDKITPGSILFYSSRAGYIRLIIAN